MTIAINQNPGSLFPEDILAVSRKGKRWRVAHTKSRREKALAHYLAGAGVGYFLPMVCRMQKSKNRVRNSYIPIFSGYVFFLADAVERLSALRSNHVARIIDVGDEVKLIEELTQISLVMSKGAQVYPYDFIAEGRWVRVRSGPLKDVVGRVVRKDRNYRLVLSVEIIMQSIAVSIDADQVEPVS
jgi:transcription antitermination factor NusG